MPKYSVIIPVYNGEHTIEQLVANILSFFSEKKDKFEIILVYDCGNDNSWGKIINLKNEYFDIIKAVKLSRNFGQHNAIIAGVKQSIGEFIITMDEDLQHDPNDIDNLINKQNESDFDLIYGKYETLNHSIFRNLTSILLKKLLEISIPDLHPDYSSFRLIKSKIAKETLTMNNSYTFIDGYLSWLTTNVSSTVVTHSQREVGSSSYTIKKLISHSINIFVTFSNLPIRFLTLLSILILFSTSIFSIYLLVRKVLYNDFLAGYVSTMVILGFGIGFIMFALGIIGEYIYRINLKTTKRPNFIESEVL